MPHRWYALDAGGAVQLAFWCEWDDDDPDENGDGAPDDSPGDAAAAGGAGQERQQQLAEKQRLALVEQAQAQAQQAQRQAQQQAQRWEQQAQLLQLQLLQQHEQQRRVRQQRIAELKQRTCSALEVEDFAAMATLTQQLRRAREVDDAESRAEAVEAAAAEAAAEAAAAAATAAAPAAPAAAAGIAGRSVSGSVSGRTSALSGAARPSPLAMPPFAGTAAAPVPGQVVGPWPPAADESSAVAYTDDDDRRVVRAKVARRRRLALAEASGGVFGPGGRWQPRRLCLEVVSANGIRDVQLFGKQSPYVVVHLLPSRAAAAVKRTKAALVGGTAPDWGAPCLQFDMGCAFAAAAEQQGRRYDELSEQELPPAMPDSANGLVEFGASDFHCWEAPPSPRVWFPAECESMGGQLKLCFNNPSPSAAGAGADPGTGGGAAEEEDAADAVDVVARDAEEPWLLLEVRSEGSAWGALSDEGELIGACVCALSDLLGPTAPASAAASGASQDDVEAEAVSLPLNTGGLLDVRASLRCVANARPTAVPLATYGQPQAEAGGG